MCALIDDTKLTIMVKNKINKNFFCNMKLLLLYKIKILVKTNEKNLLFNKIFALMIKNKCFFIFSLVFFLFGTGKIANSQSFAIKTVVIDAGHGGKDPGAVGKISKEKDLTLKMALMFGEEIKKAFPSIKVIYTRDTDKYLALHERANIANKNHADLFISIHINASDSKSANGTETFVMGIDKSGANLNVVKLENSVILQEENYQENYGGFDPNDPESHIIFSLYQNVNLNQSLVMAQAIQDKFTKDVKRFSRGVKQAPFLVLWKTSMPSVLVELGFISNLEEEKYLNSDAGQKALVKAMFDAFKVYKKSYEDESVEPANSKNNEPEIKTEVNKEENKIEIKEETKVEQEVKQTENQKITNEETVAKPAESEIIFKIQIMTSAKKIEIKPKNFKSYQNVDVYLQGGMYKYTIGRDSDYDKIVELHKKVKLDYSDSFIVAFKNGERIPLNEARSQQKNK